ncbi:MAG: helix-turn-helix domain-containing protein [Bacteroidales bacterium]|jgi:AraC-like DNA-binding protein|nr:helix-turn-helix domain-containing protein [Bacteroidales bacterium]
MKDKKYIPTQKFNEELGLEIRHHINGVDEKGRESYHYLDGGDERESEKFYAHRNDNYFFLLAEKGYASMNIDFNVVKFVERDAYFVAPGQVQADVKADECDYWYIEVATSLIPKEYLEIFENASPFQTPQNMDASEFEQCQCILRLLAGQHKSDQDSVYYWQLTQELLQTFLCMLARQYVKNDNTFGDAVSRPQQISRDFRRLVKENIKSKKSPSYYAEKLNISETYLNEAVKKTTGFTAGYWIKDYVMLEAKRLLSHTEMNVKEIAHTLGYDDHTYFSKLFRQTTGITPLAFRAEYLK